MVQWLVCDFEAVNDFTRVLISRNILFFYTPRLIIPSENRHEADRAKSRQITTLHAPQYPSKKCRFPRWEIEPNVGTSRHIINHDINRY